MINKNNKDLHNTYYNYYVYNSTGINLVTDPYAKSCNVNGTRGLVVDFARTNPENWDTLPLKWDKTDRDLKSPNELSVYESLVMVFTYDESKNENLIGNIFYGFLYKFLSIFWLFPSSKKYKVF